MAGRAVVLCLALASGCVFDPSGVGAGDDTAPGGDGGRVDGSTLDDGAAPVDAVPLGPWGTPQAITQLSDPAGNDDPSATGDLLELYFNSSRSGGPGGGDIWVSKRTSIDQPWGSPVVVQQLSTSAGETTPEVQPDGLTIFVASSMNGSTDIFMSTRPDRDSSWGPMVEVSELNSSETDSASAANEAMTRIVFTTSRDGDAEIYEASRPGGSGSWSQPMAVMEVNSDSNDYSPFLDPSGLVLYLDSDPTFQGDHDLYVTSRVSLTAPFETPVRIAELASSSSDDDPWVSPDGRTMLFARGGEIMISTR